MFTYIVTYIDFSNTATLYMLEGRLG